MSTSSANLLQLEKDEFKIVSGKKKIRRRICNDDFDKLSFLSAVEISTCKFHFRRVQTIRDDIKLSEYFNDSFNTIKSCLNQEEIELKIICFGIGSFTNCIIALHQFCYLLELRDRLNIESAEIYDPVFGENECNILEELEWKILKENLEGKYEINRNGLNIVYLPHCPKQLTNNFLWKNWSVESLRKCILISNSFQSIVDHTATRILEEEVQFIMEISKYIKEYEIENNYQFKDIFNDLSVHVLSEETLNSVDERFWSLCIDNEPKYIDLEIISNKVKSNCNINR